MVSNPGHVISQKYHGLTAEALGEQPPTADSLTCWKELRSGDQTKLS